MPGALSQSQYLHKLYNENLARPGSEFLKLNMEIVLSLRNFSFYTSSETAYLQGTVLIKKHLENSENLVAAFAEIQKGSKLNFRFRCKDQPDVSEILFSEKIVKIKTSEIITPNDPSRCISFVAESVERCEI